MTNERFNDLMSDETLSLTQEEIDEGWHFCFEFDGLLVKGDPNEKYCGASCVAAESPPKSKCNCIDCGGTEPNHSPDCEYMKELTQECAEGNPQEYGDN